MTHKIDRCWWDDT